ncbi:MAG: ABC transporter permease subunit [Opitutales bacterium]|nr:ABC transporter permease subunit [Opitutales bacterium]
MKEKTQSILKIIFGVLTLCSLYVFFCKSFFCGLGMIGIVTILAAKFLNYRLNPLTAKKLKRFREIKRGYISFWILLGITIITLFAELYVNDRALIVHYQGKTSFPTYNGIELGSKYGLAGVDGQTPVNYRDLKKQFAEAGEGNWVIMPAIPYNPNEQTSFEGYLKPRPPDGASRHYLGTDTTGRDILARLIYGFRIAILFALCFMLLTYSIGISIGCLMGYFGGLFDLIAQRLIEIWSNIPFLYMVIIAFSVVPTSIGISARIILLLIIMGLFSWTGMTYYMRTSTYREKSRDYTAAAIVSGAGTWRIIFNHIIPNTISTIVTFMPFTVVAAITSITALDFLGLGLPPPTASMGELLKQGKDNLTTAPWIVTSAFTTLVFLLSLVTFIGEAVREAFDPKKFTTYR